MAPPPAADIQYFLAASWSAGKHQNLPISHHHVVPDVGGGGADGVGGGMGVCVVGGDGGEDVT